MTCSSSCALSPVRHKLFSLSLSLSLLWSLQSHYIRFLASGRRESFRQTHESENMRQSPWACTVFIQLSLCVAIYVSLHLGHSLLFSDREAGSDNGGHLDLHFVTVSGGFRPRRQQNLLLNLMGSVARSYNARFVLFISDLGDKDPLFRNATRLSSPLKLPWYITGASRENESGYLTKRINLPTGGALDIVFIGTGSSQQGPTNDESHGSGGSRVNDLTRTLNAATADWRIAVGSEPLFVGTQGNEPEEVKQVDETLDRILISNGVNVYLSDKGCVDGANRRSDIACIVVPSPAENRRSSSSAKRQMEDGFLLHRLSFSDLVTSFIDSSGQVMETRLVKQKGKNVM